MAYVSLYRKYRPQTFHDIVGQDHVTGTLVNAIQTGQVHHAMLFCGTRGTGKTSTARVLAKALNCVKGPTPEPCNVCDACTSITDGTNLDVTEIDAASHGSVDDARDLREKASYAPAAARFKVYIIDEAHMVTTQGFNAMLKVLEEPPEHVRFIFCTTEPHKVIEAIRSRCQRHDFRRIRTAALVQDFARICEAEGVDIEPAALELVARAADGSHRDGLSRLDQVLTFAGPKVTLADVAQVLGALPVELRFDLAEALAAHRVADVLACVERVVDAGHDLHQFTREALEHLRDLYVLRVAPQSTTLVDVTAETRERLAAQAERFGPGELGRMLTIVGDLYLDLRTATDQRLVVEVGLARAAVPEASLDAEALLARIERLERRLSIAGAESPAPAGPPPAVAEATARAAPATSPPRAPPRPANEPAQGGRPGPDPARAPAQGGPGRHPDQAQVQGEGRRPGGRGAGRGGWLGAGGGAGPGPGRPRPGAAVLATGAGTGAGGQPGHGQLPRPWPPGRPRGPPAGRRAAQGPALRGRGAGQGRPQPAGGRGAGGDAGRRPGDQGGGRRAHRPRGPRPTARFRPAARARPGGRVRGRPGQRRGPPDGRRCRRPRGGRLGRQGARREGHRGASERLVRQGRRPGREEGTVAMGMPRGGGFNPNQMLKQLQKMQREMEDTQAQLAEEVVEGTAGGGVVTARVKGDQTVESVSIDPDALDPDDVEMLGDLVTAAVNEGLRKAKDLAAERLGGITQGMGLPPGLGL